MKSKWKILGVLLIGWIIGTTIYIVKYLVVPLPSTYIFESVKFIFLSISAFGVLFSALLSSFNSLEASSNIKDRIEFDKTENAFNYMTRWDSPSLKEARDETRRIKKMEQDVSPNNLLNDIKTNESLERSVITMFNFFEEIYLSIESKRVNEKILREAFAVSYTDIYGRFKRWIDNNSDGVQKSNLNNLYKIWE